MPVDGALLFFLVGACSLILPQTKISIDEHLLLILVGLVEALALGVTEAGTWVTCGLS